MPTRTSQQETPKKAPASSGKANALQRPLQPSEALAAVVGPEPLSRGEVVSKVWEYIKSHNLQNPENRREILADDKLKERLRQGQGDHVRDEQAPHPAPDLTACAIGLAAADARPAHRRSHGHPIPPMTTGDSRSAGRAAPAGDVGGPLQSRLRERQRASDQELEHVLVVTGCRGTEWGGCGSERRPAFVPNENRENGRAPLQNALSCADIGWACLGLCRAVRRASHRSKALSRSAGTDCPRGYSARPQRQFTGAIGEEA